jgi:CRP-like cAMP-binding protein
MRMVAEEEKEMHPKLEMLNRMSIFQKAPDFYRLISPMMKVQQYQRGQMIVEDGMVAERLFWIISGTCEVTKTVPFLSTMTG